jgi:CheY-like chemotaxis protein
MSIRTVLIVDSSPLTTRRVEEALPGQEYKVVVATTQAEVDALLEREPISVVVASLVYPKGNGYDLCRQVKTLFPDALVFLLCGPFEVYSKERARQAGVTDRIQRPLAVESFKKQLEQVLGPFSRYEAEVVTRPVRQPDPTASVPAAPLHVPTAEERLATFLPRSYPRNQSFVAEPQAIAAERAVSQVLPEVLPEVVEAVLNNALLSSPALRELVAATVEQVVREQVGAIATRLIQDRLRELAEESTPEKSPTG